jgi:hypothetical protein
VISPIELCVGGCVHPSLAEALRARTHAEGVGTRPAQSEGGGSEEGRSPPSKIYPSGPWKT